MKPYHQLTIARRKHHKLLPKYFDPFQIIAMVGSVAYKLGLLVGSQIHDVFHVSLLKEYKGPQPAVVAELPLSTTVDGSC